MEKEFVPNEQAIALKELGFDEPCFMSYRGKFDLYRKGIGGYLSEMSMERNSDLDKYEINKREQYWISAPTYRQAFSFFREKYKLKGDVRHANSNGTYTYTIWRWNFDNNIGKWQRIGVIHSWNDYEEAELACLIKLIEIVKNK